jgi:hypothetical protein
MSVLRAVLAVALLAALAALLLWTWRAHGPARPGAVHGHAPPVSDGNTSDAGVTTRPPPPPPLPPAPPTPVAGVARVVLRAAWGAGPGQLGRRADPESLAEGPMSFFVDRHGLTVLDNVNGRLVRFDPHGRPLAPLPLSDGTGAQDLARIGERTAVLDRLRTGRVSLYDDGGRALATVPLVGPGIDEAASITGLFADRAGRLFAERQHQTWLQLLDAGGAPVAARANAPGRPTRDGGYVSAAITDRAAGTITVQRFDAAGKARWDALVPLGAPILYIALLDADAAGNVYVAAHVGHPAATAPYAIADETLRISGIDVDGRVAPAPLIVPAPPPREEAFRDLAVGDDGTIYWMRRTPGGVVIEAYRLR